MTDDSKDQILFHATPDREMCSDGQKHDWQGWREFTCEGGGGGGETFCARCGIGAMEHSLRYGA